MQTFLDQYGPMIGAIGLIVAVAGLVVAFLAVRRLKSLQTRWGKILEGSNSDSLESLLKDHLDRVLSLSGRIDGAVERISSLETKMESSKRYVGVVRYDAFEDTGGAQSFALAIYDENGDGAVVTSQVGRADCRVYAKEIKGGKSDRELSREEKLAIEAAVKKKAVVGTRF